MALATYSGQNKFYVYLHKKQSNGSIFYVGKGFGNRCNKTTNRNQYWHNIVKKHGFTVDFIATGLDEELALLVEQEKIDQLRRLGYKLCNLTDGGDGVSGLKFSSESLKKLSESHKGIRLSQETRDKLSKIRTGIPKTEEQKRKISLANKGKKKTPHQVKSMIERLSKNVICVETGEIFLNAYEAAKKMNISRTGIGRVCRGERKTAGKYTWRFVE